MKLSVVIPVYNEERTIKDVIERVDRVPLEKEIIIIDDCSKDGTRGILEKLSARRKDIRIIYSSPNRGKGCAIKKGFGLATGDVVLIQDADLEYDPQDYLPIVKAFTDHDCPAVYGSRFLGECGNMSFLQLFANRLFTGLTNLIHRAHMSDTCTCYKAFRTGLIKNLPLESDGFEICHEINAKLLRRGVPIIEVPIHYYARTHKEGKKAGWKTFFISLRTIYQYGIVKKG